MRRYRLLAVLSLSVLFSTLVQAKTFHCGAGDVQCLIAAMNEANASGKKNEIRLEAGTYTLIVIDNNGTRWDEWSALGDQHAHHYGRGRIPLS